MWIIWHSANPLPCTVVSTEAELANSSLGFGLHLRRTLEVNTFDKFRSAIVFQVSTTKLITPTISSFLSDVSWVELLLQRGTPNESVTGWGIFGTLVRTWRTPGNKCKYIIVIVHSLIKTFIWLICCQQVLQEMITKVLPIFRKCRNLGRNVQI